MLNSTPTHPQANSYLTLDEAKELIEGRYGAEQWDELNDAQKESLLKIATKNIDGQRYFNTERIHTPQYYRMQQYLKFPRTGGRSITGKVQTAGENFITDVNLKDRADMPDDFWNYGAIIITDGTGKGQTYKISDFQMSTGKVTVAENFGTQPDTTSYYLLVEKVPEQVKNALIEQVIYLMTGGGERAKLQAEGVKSYSIGDLSETFVDGATGSNIPLSPQARGYLKGFISRIGTMY